MKKLKWCVIKSSDCDMFIDICKDKEDAISVAKDTWNRLTYHEKKRTNVIAGTMDPDDYDCGDIYDIAWESE